MTAQETPTHIELFIIRHGQTPGNAEKRYVGCADDQPLSDEGRKQAQASQSFPDVQHVYVSVLRRTHETAAIMFPNAEQTIVEGIQEMDFGAFTGRSADEMADDPDYCAWVDGWCEGVCPGGESKAQFNERICTSMESFLREAAARGEQVIHLVAHGGTMMAFLSHYGNDERLYYEWNAQNCHGYHLDIQLSSDTLSVEGIKSI